MMGGHSTKQNETEAGHYLTADDLTSLKKLFHTFNTLVAPVGPKGEKTLCSPYQDFQRHCERYLHDWLAARVADKLSVHWPRQEQIIPLTNVLIFVSKLLKGYFDDKVTVIWDLARPGVPAATDLVTATDMMQYTRSIIESYIKCVEQTPIYRSWVQADIGNKLMSDSITDLAEFVLNDLLYDQIPNKEIIKQSVFVKDAFDREEFAKCFNNSVLLQQLHSSIISFLFSMDLDIYYVRLLPLCTMAQSAMLPEYYSVLDISRIMFLNAQLPPELRTKWRFLFSTVSHGESFAKLVGKIKGQGPTIVIIKEKGREGHIFGSFCPHNWTYSPKFYGDKNSFLFHLSPKFAVYPATGYNENFQYLNVQQQTFPNGMGFGGKLEYFTIWIDAEFGKGKIAPSSTTYSCPPMAQSDEFSIEHVEVWGLGPEPTKDENERGEQSILDKDIDTKVVLEMVDRGCQSEKMGLREQPHCDE